MKEQLQKRQIRAKLGRSGDGKPTANSSESLTTSSSTISTPPKINLMGAFAMALHVGQLSGPAYGTLAEKTTRSTISYVAQTFRENGRPNPTKDKDGELGRLLSQQYRAFRNDDPNPVQQKSTPICVLT